MESQNLFTPAELRILEVSLALLGSDTKNSAEVLKLKKRVSNMVYAEPF